MSTKPKLKYNSHCFICKKPAVGPKGNYNAQRITLCKSPKCHRQRKNNLQNYRRRQLKLALFCPLAATY